MTGKSIDTPANAMDELKKSMAASVGAVLTSFVVRLLSL